MLRVVDPDGRGVAAALVAFPARAAPEVAVVFEGAAFDGRRAALPAKARTRTRDRPAHAAPRGARRHARR